MNWGGMLSTNYDVIGLAHIAVESAEILGFVGKTARGRTKCPRRGGL